MSGKQQRPLADRAPTPQVAPLGPVRAPAVDEEVQCKADETNWLDALMAFDPIGTSSPPPAGPVAPGAPAAPAAPAVDTEEQARLAAEEQARVAAEAQARVDAERAARERQLAQDIFTDLDDAMGVGAFNLTDADAAQRLLAGRSATEMAAIRTYYQEQTGRSLEGDVTEQFGGVAENEMMANVIRGMDLRDQIEHYETSESMENLIQTATPEQLEALAQDPTVLATLRDKMDPQALMEARSRLFPDQRVEAVLERIEAANGYVNDDEGAVMAAFQTLSIEERQTFLENHTDSLDFLSSTERERMTRMAESEASALRERMIQATSGAGTDDEALDGLAADAGRLVGEQRRLQEQLEGNDLPDGERAAIERRLAEMGDVTGLMTPQRNEDGSLVDGSFFDRLEGDVGDDRMHALMGQMGVEQSEVSKQRVLDAIGTFNDDERGIQEAFAALPADQRVALWNDPNVLQALGHLNAEEQATVAAFRDNDVAEMAATRIDEANGWASQDEAAILRSVMDMNDADREAFMQTQEYRDSYDRMNEHERLALAEAIATGSISLETSMDAATIGLGTNDELIALASERKSADETLAVRRGYVLAQEGIEPETDEDRAALASYRALSEAMHGDMDDDEYQQAMDALLAHTGPRTDAYTGDAVEGPSSAAIERSTAEGRMTASLLMDARADELMGPDGEGGGGLSAWLSDTDETAVQAHQSQKGSHYEALFDGEVSEAELAGHEALSEVFADDFDAMVAAQNAITDAVATGVSVAAAIAITLATSGAAGPAVAAFMAQYGTLVTGATTLATSVGTKQLMGGGRYDVFGEAGATDVGMSVVDAATGHLAGKAGESVRRSVSGVIPSVVSEGTQEVTGAMLREGVGGVLRHEAGGILVESTVDALASGAMGSVVGDLTSEQFYQGGFGDSMLDMGAGVVESVPGSLQSAATQSLFKGVGTAWSAHRLEGFMGTLEARGMAGAEVEGLDMKTLDGLAHAQLMLDAGNPERAAAVLRGLEGLTPEQREAYGAALQQNTAPDAGDAIAPDASRTVTEPELTPEIQAALDPDRVSGPDAEVLGDPSLSEEVRLELAQQQVEAVIDGGLEGPMAEYLIENLDDVGALESVLQTHDLGLGDRANSFVPALVESGIQLDGLEPAAIGMVGEAYQAVADGNLEDAMAALELAGLTPVQRSELLERLVGPVPVKGDDHVADMLFPIQENEDGYLDLVKGDDEFESDGIDLDDTQEYTAPWLQVDENGMLVDGQTQQIPLTDSPGVAEDHLKYNLAQGEMPGTTAFVQGTGDAHAVDMGDVCQGYLGDCWLMGSMAAVAQADPGQIESLIKPNDDGTFNVTLHLPDAEGNLSPQEIRIDGSVPLHNDSPFYAGPGDVQDGQTEMWPALLEKALAAQSNTGTYDGIVGRNASSLPDGLELLTGQKGRVMPLESMTDAPSRILQALGMQMPVTVGTRGAEEGSELQRIMRAAGLFENHMYAPRGVDLENRMIDLFNPHGQNHPSLSFEDFEAHFDYLWTTTPKS